LPGWKTGGRNMLNVLLVNDDTTPMEFVVEVLEDLFGKSREEAIKIMLEAHQRGRAVCGAYPDAQARDLASEAALLAQDAGLPLQFSLADASG
jgi:ATP-dependent Clp protease adaptor protein ClpS